MHERLKQVDFQSHAVNFCIFWNKYSPTVISNTFFQLELCKMLYCTILIVCKPQLSSKNKRINMRFTKLDVFTSYLIATSPSVWEYFHLYTGGIMAKTWRWDIIDSSSFPSLKNRLTCGKWRSRDRVPISDPMWGGLLECCYEGFLLSSKRYRIIKVLIYETSSFLPSYIHTLDNCYKNVLFRARLIVLCPMTEKNHWQSDFCSNII